MFHPFRTASVGAQPDASVVEPVSEGSKGSALRLFVTSRLVTATILVTRRVASGVSLSVKHAPKLANASD